jgi:hypothetical protein
MCNIAFNLFIVELRDTTIRSTSRASVDAMYLVCWHVVVPRKNGQILQKAISAKKWKTVNFG